MKNTFIVNKIKIRTMLTSIAAYHIQQIRCCVTTLGSSSKTRRSYKLKSQSIFVNTSAKDSFTAFPTGLEVEGDEPLPLSLIAEVVEDLVRGHVMAVGGAPVGSALASHLGAHGDEGKAAAIAVMNLAVGVGLVKSAEQVVVGGIVLDRLKRKY